MKTLTLLAVLTASTLLSQTNKQILKSKNFISFKNHYNLNTKEAILALNCAVKQNGLKKYSELYYFMKKQDLEKKFESTEDKNLIKTEVYGQLNRCSTKD